MSASARNEPLIKLVPIDAIDHSVICVTQLRGIRFDHADRLDVRRRTSDDAQISPVAVCCSNDSLSS